MVKKKVKKSKKKIIVKKFKRNEKILKQQNTHTTFK